MYIVFVFAGQISAGNSDNVNCMCYTQNTSWYCIIRHALACLDTLHAPAVIERFVTIATASYICMRLKFHVFCSSLFSAFFSKCRVNGR